MATEDNRFWTAVRGLLRSSGGSGAPDYPDDPEELLARAQQEMRDLHAKNRERAVQAITQKNNLQQIVNETEKRIVQLQQKARQAEHDGDAALAEQLHHERQTYEAALETTRTSLEQAEALAERVKQAIRREEDKIRQKTAHALALKMQWRALQLHREIARSVRAAEFSPASAVPADRARELLEQAKAQRDELAAVTERISGSVVSLRQKAELARRQGSEEAERALLREMEQNEAALAQMREALAQAVEVTTQAERYLNGEADAEDLARWSAIGAAAPSEYDATPGQGIVAEERFDALTYTAVLGLGVVLAAALLLLLWWLLR